MRAAVVLLACGALVACSGTDAAPSPTIVDSPSAPRASTRTPASTSPATGPVRLTVAGTIATGLNVPWGLVFLPDRTALVAERDTGKVKRIAGTTVTEVGTIEGVDPSSEGGLLGLAVDPRFASRPYVYVYFSTSEDNRIARYTWRDGRLVDPHVILDGIGVAAVHNGGRLAFGPDGYLYVGTGENHESERAQDPNDLGGKILRITVDGKPAPGNPRRDSPIYTTGHRNVQGLAFGDDGQLYASEFGQDDWDELNAITAGANYGWPAAEGIAGLEGMVDPIAQWLTDVASPSGIAYAQGTIFMAGLRGRRLWAIPVAGGRRTGEPQAFFIGEFGRLRTVVAAPDGSLWLTTSNTDGRADPREGDDRILRITISR
jgi:glucose/arabinose dehydrogenase